MFQSTGDKQNPGTQFDTVLGPLVKVSGSLENEGNVRFAGTYKSGNFKIGGLLEIAPEARVEAEINAQTVRVLGEVKGNINAEQVVIGASGKVYGDISAGGNLVIESGGIFVGTSVLPEMKHSKPKNTEKKEEKEE
jgi:cytoskeletal protein CcmA (bactofilin family)